VPETRYQTSVLVSETLALETRCQPLVPEMLVPDIGVGVRDAVPDAGARDAVPDIGVGVRDVGARDAGNADALTAPVC
jgi:hypothetical protein